MEQDSLSGEEIRMLVDNSYLISVKRILNKTHSLLGKLREEQKELWKNYFPEVFAGSGKISRGSNYKDLPYLVLDYPNIFRKDEVLACRTMVWWGNGISCTLHLQGKALEKYRPRIQANLGLISQSDVYICINPSPWEFHFGEDNYRKLEELEQKKIQNILKNHDFIKISRRLPVKEINKLGDFGMQTFRIFIRALSLD